MSWRFRSLPARLRLSSPKTTTPGSARDSSIASVLPTKPHTPVIRILTGRLPCSGQPILPGCDDRLGDQGEILSDRPARIVGHHLGQVAVVADVIADAVLVHVGVSLSPAAHRFGQRERLQDGARVLL